MTRDEAAELAEGELLEYREGGVWRVGQVYRPMTEGRATVAMLPDLSRRGVVREVEPIDLRR
jgi:hypothetical protein